MNRSGKIILSLVSFVLVIEFFLLKNSPFFWDALTKATRANWIYTNNFRSIIVPVEYNSGHPPLWIVLVALFWTLLGKSVWAARLLLLLVNLSAVYQIFRLCEKSFVSGISVYFFLLIVIDPTLIAQTSILNNDMLLLFFILLGLTSLLSNKWILYAIALTGLFLTNLRGVYCVISFALIHWLWLRYSGFLYIRNMLRAYLISILVFAGFLVYQYYELGWIIISGNENYAAHREIAGINRILKNSAAFVKNLFDFGRIFLWIPLGLLLLGTIMSKKRRFSKRSNLILIALLVFLGVFFLGFVPFSNPMGPRYLMICYLLAAILFVNLLHERHIKNSLRKGMVVTVVLGLLTGHFWIYPSSISQGWDSSLAYLNYYPVEQKMFNYISENNIPIGETGTHLPLNSKHIASVGGVEKFDPPFALPDLDKNTYFLFSNIENRTQDDDIETLQTMWEEMATFSRLGVFITLYKSP